MYISFHFWRVCKSVKYIITGRKPLSVVTKSMQFPRFLTINTNHDNNHISNSESFPAFIKPSSLLHAMRFEVQSNAKSPSNFFLSLLFNREFHISCFPGSGSYNFNSLISVSNILGLIQMFNLITKWSILGTVEGRRFLFVSCYCRFLFKSEPILVYWQSYKEYQKISKY